MEIFRYYKSYGVRYMQIGGTVQIEHYGHVIKSFRGKGEQEGSRLAENFIDELELNINE